MHTHLLGGFYPRNGGKGQWPLQLTSLGCCVRAEGKLCVTTNRWLQQSSAWNTYTCYAKIAAHLLFLKWILF